MKIVYLAPFGIRPKGTLHARMLPLASHLVHRGHELVIIAPPYTNPEDSGKVEECAGVKIVNVRLPRIKNPLSPLLLGWRMLRAAMAEDPEIIHLFKPKGYAGVAAMLGLVGKKFGFQLPALFIDTDDWEGRGGMNDLQPYSGAEKTFFHFQENWLPPRALGVTVASRALQTQVWGMGVPTPEVLYLPNCVHECNTDDGLKIRGERKIGEEERVVLLYTRFFEFSQQRLHTVFRGIHAACPEVKFLIVGKGRQGEEDELEKSARENGFNDHLIMAGWTEPEDIPAYLAAADVAIYPLDDNLINRAKCPAKLTEIMLAGCPVVADAVGQACEYVRPGRTGMLVDPEKPEEMVAEVVRLLNDRERCREFGEAGRLSMLNDFNWADSATRLETFYLKKTGLATDLKERHE